MTHFCGLSSHIRSLLTLWALLCCITGICGVVTALATEKKRYALLSLVPSLSGYFLWQADFARNIENETAYGHLLSCILKLGDIPWFVWIIILSAFTVLAVLALTLTVRRGKTHISPLSIKYCADKMPCGICYWRDNGRILFSNDCMNRLCLTLTGKALANGNLFREAVSAGICRFNKEVWHFTCRDLVFDGELLHEMLAWDITDLHAKAEKLRKENDELARLNRDLKAYQLSISDTILRREILQAKVNIHDEMNRLMLSTVATDMENTEELNRLFSLWEQNALLLCLETNAERESDAAEKAASLAETLGIKTVWEGDIPVVLGSKQRDLFYTALREATVNAKKHADAETLTVSFSSSPSEILACFMNSSAVTRKDVRFLGGLKNLSVLATEQNATVEAEFSESASVFKLTLHFPKEA